MLPRLSVEGPRARIDLCRPESANRLAREDLAALMAHCRLLAASPDVRVVELHAQGRTFCSGFNLPDLVAPAPGQPSAPRAFAHTMDAWAALPQVTVAALQGPAMGGGFDLALCCDVRVGTPQVRAAVPAVRLGLQFYRTGLERAVQRLPWWAVQRLFLQGRSLDAGQLQQAGFFAEWCAVAEDLPGRVEDTVTDLLGLAPLALRGVKRSLRALEAGGLTAAQAEAIDALAAATEASHDLREGVQSWVEQRPPVFRGR